MNNVLHLRRASGLLVSGAAMLSAALSVAAEPSPGDACSTAGLYTVAAGPEVAAGGHLLVCDGATWNAVVSFNRDGEATTIGAQSCGNGDVLTYNSSIWTCGTGGSGSSLWEEVGGVLRPSSGTSLQWGDGNASGNYSTAWGTSAGAHGSYSTAWGDYAEAFGSYSTVWGQSSYAFGDYSTAWGSVSYASGDYSTAWGWQNHAGSYAETSLGRYSDNTAGTAGSWVATDVLFEIGNGTSGAARANALTVLKNGNVGIGATAPESALYVPDGKYLQAEDNNAGAPPSSDCDADAERGRISLDTTNNRIYVCMGVARGWDYSTLAD